MRSPSWAPATTASAQCSIQAVRPARVPVAYALSAPVYAVAPASRWPNSGTPTPVGSRPRARSSARSAARATSALPPVNGRTSAISACTSAATSGAGADVARTRSLMPASRSRTSDGGAGSIANSGSGRSAAVRGRPRTSADTSGCAAARCSRARPCAAAAEAPDRYRSSCSVSAVACTAPRTRSQVGSLGCGQRAAPVTRSRTTSSDTRAPSSRALAHAPRTRDSAAASGMRRRRPS